MKFKLALLGVAGAAALVSLPAQAAPAVGTIAQAAGQTSAVEKVDYRRCWWRNGKRHCRWVEEPVYGYGGYGYGGTYGNRSPESLRPGSNDWWRAMDREERGGR